MKFLCELCALLELANRFIKTILFMIFSVTKTICEGLKLDT
jgi:hypothetical protein